MRLASEGERGSILLLGIGLFGACLLALAAIIDAATLFQQRQALLAVADGASLAGAQAIDLDRYYEAGATRATVLEPKAVRAAVLGYVRSSAVGGVRVEAVSSDGEVAVVEVSAPITLPFLGPVVSERIRVRSAARLDLVAQ